MIMLPLRVTVYLTKRPVPQMGNLSLCVWQRIPRVFQNITGYWHCPWLPPEFQGKTLLLKMPHTLVTEHWRTELELIPKPIPSGLAFIVSGGAAEAAKGEKQLKAPSSCKSRQCTAVITSAISIQWCKSSTFVL